MFVLHTVKKTRYAKKDQDKKINWENYLCSTMSYTRSGLRKILKTVQVPVMCTCSSIMVSERQAATGIEKVHKILTKKITSKNYYMKTNLLKANKKPSN